MKEKIIKTAKSLILVLLKWLSKQDNKYGFAAKNLLTTIESVENAAKDKIITESEIKEIAGNSTDTIISVVSLFCNVEIKLKK